jgi:superfamily I DNA/RNA helicase
LTIIIGPPGTGKTQVITALQQRISELSHESIQRSILLTSYQHDAVDNVVDRSNVMGIAGLRVGGKIRNDDDDSTGVDTIEKWATPIQKELNQLIRNNDFISLYRNLEEHLLKLRFGYRAKTKKYL